jgi:hypothetical protein
MASRNELNMRAAAVGFDGSTIANDSKLEQKVLWLEKNSSPAITGTAPTGTITASGVAVAGNTITIGDVTYTFRAAITAASPANEVKIGAAATNSLDNLKDAINGTANVGAPGTEYSQATVRHPLVTAGAKDATTLVVASTDTNANGALATTETMTNWAWGASTLSAGTLGSKNQSTSTTAGPAGLSGDRNTSL